MCLGCVNEAVKNNPEKFPEGYIIELNEKESFPDPEIVNTRVHNLEWSHVRRVLSVTNAEARLWYLENASLNMWSVRELDRNISTQ